MPTLPTHPRTGLTALGWTSRGPIWPVLGGDGTGDAGATEPADGDGSQPADQNDGQGDDAQPPGDPTAELAKWKALSRKHEAQAKANADAAQRLKQIEDAGKSETEKLQALLNEQQSKARDATVRALKLQVAADKGLSPQLAKFLPDLDEEVDMLAAADELLEASGSAGKGGHQPTRQPKSTLTNPLGDEDPAAQREAILNSMMGKAAT